MITLIVVNNKMMNKFLYKRKKEGIKPMGEKYHVPLMKM